MREEVGEDCAEEGGGVFGGAVLGEGGRVGDFVGKDVYF